MCITSKAARNFTFGTLTTPDNVGPGMYNPSNKHDRYHAPIPFGSTTRREIFPTAEDTSNLAPGMYNPVYIPRISHSSLNFGKRSERKYFIDTQHNPGPANYSQLDDWTKGVHKVPKTAIPENIDTRVPFDITPLKTAAPGPGDYDVKPVDDKKGISFSQSRAPQREPVYDNGIPGPGYYNTEAKKQKLKPSPPFRGSTEERDIFDTKHALDGYMLEHKAWKAEEPSNRPFGGLTKRDLQFVKNNGVPGPGNYVLPSTIMPKKVTKRSDFGIDRDPYKGYPVSYPGPGFYEVEKTKGKGVVIPKADRGSLFDVQKTPAPGQYDINEEYEIEAKEKRRIPNPAFKSSIDRDCLTSKEPNPGPAAYSRLAKEPKSGMKFSKGKRFGNDETCTPGPDAYTLKDESKPAPSIGRSSVPKPRITNTPGPGAYGDVRCEMYKPSFNAKLDER